MSALHIFTRLILVTVLLLNVCCSTGPTKHDVLRTDTADIDVDPELEHMFANAYRLLQQNELVPAIALLEKIIARERRLPAPYVNLGMAYRRSGDRQMAETYLIRALRLDVGHPVANNELALLYRESGRVDAARISYQNALAVHPDYLPARKNLGILCEIYLHDLDCALAQYRQYLQRSPDDRTVNNWVLYLEQRTVRK